MAVNPNHREINAEAARRRPATRCFHHYRRLIELRHAEPAVALGDFTMLLPDDERVYAFTRRLGDVELLVLGNFSGEAAHADVPEELGGGRAACSATSRTRRTSPCARGRRGSTAAAPRPHRIGR